MSNPFIKVSWEDTSENLTQERIKRVKTYFEKKYNSKNVKIVTKTLTNDDNTKLKSLDVSDNILDPQYQKLLVKDFITENKINVNWDMINRLDDRVNGEIDKITQKNIRYNKWEIKKIEFSNFLSFGDDNVINFETLDGITVVESYPKNFGGKTTATVDLLLFLFFGITTKTKTNIEVFNRFNDTEKLFVRGYITIDGYDYVITRTYNRKKSRSGEYKVETSLEYNKINSDGTISNESGEQRSETEKIITNAIGDEEDFLSTILTTGNNLEQLIESKPTARGQILTKFLGLESLKQKEEICKKIYSDWSKKLVSNTNNIEELKNKNEDYRIEIETSENSITENQSNLIEVEHKLKNYQSERDQLLKSRNDVDQELIKLNPDTLKLEINQLEKKRVESQKYADEIVVVEPTKYYLEDEHEKLKTEINGLIIESRVNTDAINRSKKLIEQLENGTVCPTCNRTLDDVDHTDEINKIKLDVDKLLEIEETNKSKQQELIIKEQEFSLLKKEYDEYEKNKLRKAKYELEVEQRKLELETKKNKLTYYETNKLKLEENQKIDIKVTNLKTLIDSTNGEIRTITTTIERNTNNIKNLNEKIQINDELIKKIKSEEELIFVFNTYLTIFGKNGISKVIMKNMIPLINQELYRLLVDTCYFTLELNINDKNELEFLMIDNETRVVKPLNSGSGYEKTISSLAIRSVLTKVSSLPKPNIVVMDEVFGKVADENLEMVGEFFKKIKNYFEHIFVISHNPLIRNWSDNVVMVRKDDNISKIEFITTKN